MKILTVIGARPQFVKAAVVSRALASHRELTEIIVHTGQHFDKNMSAVFFDEMGIPAPNYQFDVGGGSHAENTGRTMMLVEGVIKAEKPRVVMVYGDTDSTLAGALAAAKLGVSIAHVEAGLRSYNRRMPEEINRVLTDHLSDILFTPSETARRNLDLEGIRGDKVVGVGDVMYDAVKYYSAAAEKHSSALADLGLQSGRFVLLTVHRKENADDPRRIAAILDGMATSELPVVFPLHPRTRKQLVEFGLTVAPPVFLTDPLGYLDMQSLERHARLIATDSGGVQKEAYFHSVPCVTLRDETEWTELVELGVNVLVGADAGRIARALRENRSWIATPNIYGTGHSAVAVADYFAQMRLRETSIRN
jgi:UDP-GlcNAc3NAcA epimerase